MPEIVHLEVQPDIESLRELSVMVERLMAETGRSASDAVTYAAVKVAQSGGAACKKAKKNRAMVDNPKWKQAKKQFAWARRQQRQGKAIPADAQAELQNLQSAAPFFIERLTQGETIYLPSYDKKDPRRVIPEFTPGQLGGRGLAKKTWQVMKAKMADSRGVIQFSKRTKGYRVSKYQEKYGENSGATVARLVNRLTYLETAFPGITNRAVSKGAASLRGYLNRRIESATRRANAA